MQKYSICGLKVLMDAGEITTRQAEKYKTDADFTEADITVKPTKEAVADYLSRNNTTTEIAEYMVEAGIFYRELLRFDGVFLHASAVVVDGAAYLFSAPCGTGKSTHTAFWLELFGDKAFILNDDKPAIRVMQNGIFVFGTPFSGKHDISVPTSAKLGGICFISRGEKDEIKLMDSTEAFLRMYHASLRKITKEQLDKEFEILQKIVDTAPVYEMKCTKSLNAAKIAARAMKKA